MERLEFESTFFVVSSRFQKMVFADRNFLIIPYKAVESIVEHENSIEIALCKSFNKYVEYGKTMYLVEEGEKFSLSFDNQDEKDIFLQNFNRYKNLTKKDNL